MSLCFRSSPAPNDVSQTLFKSAPLKYPSRSDWEQHQPLIKRLYADENKRLEDVVAIMRDEHGFNATPKMYKDRIKKWRLDKKHKQDDMRAILRKKTQRDAIGKESSFQVRGRTVTIEDVRHYFKRKHVNIEKLGAFDAPTPPDIICRTPSPVMMNQIAEIEPSDLSSQFGTEFATTNAEEGTNLPQVALSQSYFDQQTVHFSPRSINRMMTNSYAVPRSPSPPQVLLVSERLFASIKIYFDGSFESGNWILHTDGLCVNTKSLDGNGYGKLLLVHSFLEFCHLSITYLEERLFIEFRRALSKAFALLRDIIRGQHPHAFDSILEALLLLKNNGHHQIALLLCRNIKDLASINEGEHLWGHICQILGTLDPDSLEDTVMQSWQCTIDAFERRYGSNNTTVISNRLSFIQQAHYTDPAKKERALRALLAQCEQLLGIASLQTSCVTTMLLSNLCAQKRYSEAEELGLDALSRTGVDVMIALKTDFLYLLAESQCYQYKDDLAEKNFRDVIEMSMERYGATDPCTIRYMNRLETWLREWGREAEADEWKAYIDLCIGPDDTDLEAMEAMGE